jgi:hypothetical protein
MEKLANNHNDLHHFKLYCNNICCKLFDCISYEKLLPRRFLASTLRRVQVERKQSWSLRSSDLPRWRRLSLFAHYIRYFRSDKWKTWSSGRHFCFIGLQRLLARSTLSSNIWALWLRCDWRMHQEPAFVNSRKKICYNGKLYGKQRNQRVLLHWIMLGSVVCFYYGDKILGV